MRLPNVEHYDDKDPIQHVTYAAPIRAQRAIVLSSDKQRDRCIKKIERICRGSMEYRDLIKYLKTNMNMDECEFLPNLKPVKGKKTTEIHHEPFDLYTLCGIMLKQYEMEHDGFINVVQIAKEVMRCHYEGLIGLIPLSGLAHELVHDGKLFVPLCCVYGRFVKFTELYYDAIVAFDDTILDMLEKKIELTADGYNDTSILNVSYVYATMQGVDNELPEYMPETDEAVQYIGEDVGVSKAA